MDTLRGYLRTIGQYWRDPKGRHDILDYLRAVLIILATVVAVCFLVSRW